jgi:FAD/FMN-containing dehydrogenase
LSRLDQVTPSSDLSTVTVGPGNRWADVYSKLDALGIAIGGGRSASVGVGGLTLGGGVSFFSPRIGFVCDNIVRFEVSLLTSRHRKTGECSSLFADCVAFRKNRQCDERFVLRLVARSERWLEQLRHCHCVRVYCLRTRQVLVSISQIKLEGFRLTVHRGGFIGHDISTKDAQFAAFEALTGSPEYDPYAALINSYVFSAAGNSWYTASNFEYTKAEANPPVFANFTSLPQSFSTMRISNLTDFTLELAGSDTIGRRQLFVTGTYGNSAKLMSTIFDIANRTVQPLIDVPSLAYSLSFQPMPTAITSKAKSRGGNSLGLDASDGNLFNLLLTVSWDTSADDARIEQHSKDLFKKAEVAAKKLGLYNKYLYLNYAASWQDPISGYGAANKAQLQAVSRKYDPRGVFQTQVPGGFKLFD